MHARSEHAGAVAWGAMLRPAIEGSGATTMARRSTGGRHGPSQRQLRVGESLRHGLAELLMRHELRDPLLAAADVTVSEVRVSADLRHATVFVSALGRPAGDQLLDALGRAAPRLRGELARRLHLKFAPELAFRADPSFDEAARIESLIARERAAFAGRAEDDDGQG